MPSVNTERKRSSSSILALDLYRQPFHLQLPDGQNEYRTRLGAVLSILTIVLLLAYGIYKTVSLIGLSYEIMLTTLDYEYGYEDGLSQANGFCIAAGVSSYDGKDFSIEDETIGEVVIYMK